LQLADGINNEEHFCISGKAEDSTKLDTGARMCLGGTAAALLSGCDKRGSALACRYPSRHTWGARVRRSAPASSDAAGMAANYECPHVSIAIRPAKCLLPAAHRTFLGSTRSHVSGGGLDWLGSAVRAKTPAPLPLCPSRCRPILLNLL
jgi:hypothetical protein